VLAASVSPEGHWTFRNAAGEALTAASPDELKRVLPMLAGATAMQAMLILDWDSLFATGEPLKALPRTLSLSVLVGPDVVPLVERDGRRHLAIRPAVLVEVGGRAETEEALRQVARRLAARDVRLLALVVDGPQTLPPRPVPDASGKAATDPIDLLKLLAALAALSGQTAIVIGRTDGPRLVFRTPAGGERAVLLGDLVAAAARHDVDLVVLQAPAARQPGTRNWLWQRIEVAGLDAARERPSVADFLDAYVGGDAEQPVAVRLADTDGQRTRLVLTRPSGGSLGGLLAGLSAEVTGRVVTTGADAYLVASPRRQELSRRVVPGVPAVVQAVYLGGLVAGLLGFAQARRWWSRIWRVEDPADYDSRVGYLTARGVEIGLFGLAFLPLVGVPALFVQAVRLMIRPLGLGVRQPSGSQGTPA
jgi:hypothetical protein